MSVEAIIFYILLIDALCASLVVLFGSKWYVQHFRTLSREEGEDLILMCYMSRDFREGLDAFLNKRQP